jgi:hypothetical protein
MKTGEQCAGIVILLFGLSSAASCGQTSNASSDAQGSKHEVQQLFSKEISAGQRIIVTREPFATTQLGSLGTTLIRQGAASASIRAELHTAGGITVLLGSAIESDFPDFRTGLNVIDVFVGTDELVVACSVSDLIGLWRISLDLHRHLPDGWAWVGSPVEYAAIIPFARDTVAVKMSPPEGPTHHEWSLTVIDKRPPQPVTILFEQVKDAWRFVPRKSGLNDHTDQTTPPVPTHPGKPN